LDRLLFYFKFVHLDILKEKLINERHNLSELKPKYNAYKETNKGLEEQIRDLQVFSIINCLVYNYYVLIVMS